MSVRPSSVARSAEQLAQAYIRACDLELEAFKPGNVHRYAPGHEMTAADFASSARLSAPALAAPGAGLGRRIYQAVRATREVHGCNTNLGIVLLAAPLLSAARAATHAAGLRAALADTLRRADVEDTDWVNRAIRLAAPGGLGRVDRHDVHGPAAAPLQQVMAAAAERDSVARQYATGYADLFAFAVPRWQALRGAGEDPAWATAGLYLAMLARWPDSHVRRRHGLACAEDLTARAGEWQGALGRLAPEERIAALRSIDLNLKEAGINPGTTADLTVAAVLIVFVQELLGAADAWTDSFTPPAALGTSL